MWLVRVVCEGCELVVARFHLDVSCSSIAVEGNVVELHVITDAISRKREPRFELRPTTQFAHLAIAAAARMVLSLISAASGLLVPTPALSPPAFTQSALAQPASRAVVQRADAGIFPTSFTLAKGVSEAMTSSSQGDLFKGDIDTLPMDSLLDTVNVDAPRRAGTDSGKAADVDEAKAAALRSAVAGSDVGLTPKEKQAAKQAAFAAKQAADSAKGFSISLPNPF